MDTLKFTYFFKGLIFVKNNGGTALIGDIFIIVIFIIIIVILIIYCS